MPKARSLTPEERELDRKVRAAVQRAGDALQRKARNAEALEARRIRAGVGASFLAGGGGVGGGHTDPGTGGRVTTPSASPSFLPPPDPAVYTTYSGDPQPQTQVVWAPQPGPQYHFIHCPVTDVVFGGARGGGKLQPLTAKILTPKGWVQLGDLRVGDIVTDPTTGGQCAVLAIYRQGEQDVYRVVCDDGATCEVGLEHLWAYRATNQHRPRTKESSQREFAIEELGAMVPDERWNTLRVGSTADLIDVLADGEQPRIPLTEPVLFTVNGRAGTGSVDPYIAGALLGDGNIESLTITACDDEIRSAISANGLFSPASVLHTDGKPKTWRARGEGRRALRQWVVNHGLSGKRAWEKFIPPYVITADIGYRLAFLQGLMDTDGTVDDRGRCSFTSTSKELAEGVRALIRGLGGKASSRERVTSYPYKGELLDGRPSWTIRCWLRRTSAMFRLSRKKARCTDSWNGGHELTRAVVVIEKVRRAETACIRVDTPYGLYVTDDYIVTHNSYSLIGDVAIRAGRYGKDFRGLFLRRQQTELLDIKQKMADVYAPLGAKWSEQHQTWTFPGGGTLVLKYLANDDDALMYKGWNLCVEQETPVLMADGSWKPIREVAVGEMVETLEGPQPVVATTEPYEAPCAEIRVAVRGVGEVARQVQPVWHHVLTTDGLSCGPSPRGSRSRPLPHDEWLPRREGGELRRGVGRGRPGWLAWQEDGPSASAASCDGLPEWRLPAPSTFRLALHEPGLRSTLRRSGNEEAWAAAAHGEVWSPSIPERGGACGTRASLGAGSPCGCRPFGGSGGGRPRASQGTAQGTAPSPAGAVERSLPSRNADAPGTAPGCTPPSSDWYWTHPYTGEGRRLRVPLRSGSLESAYVGLRMVCDISVAHANHYITLGGIVNRNTALYVDEIGDFPSHRPIDMLWGAMRSTKGVPVVRRMSCNPGGPGHCLPHGDVLTPSGWRDIRDFAVGDPVYTVARSGELQVTVVAQVHRHHFAGELVRVSEPNEDLWMEFTPNHTIGLLQGDRVNVVPWDEVEPCGAFAVARHGRDENGWIQRTIVDPERGAGVISRAPYSGPVYCLGIDGTHSFVVRQNGSVWVSGNSWVKQLYLSHGPYRVFRYAPNDERPDLTIDAVFIPSKLEDNPALMRNDPMYEARIAASCGGDKILYHAWRYGNWDILAGTYFTFDEKINCGVPPPIPDYHPRWMSMDWGYAHPSFVHWFVDFGDRAYCYRERSWTNTDPVTLGQLIAEVNGDERIDALYLSPDAFGRKQGENTVAIGLKEGFDRANQMKGLAQLPPPEMAYNDRVNGWQALATGFQSGRLLISPTCTETIRTIQGLVRDPRKPNDVVKVDGDDACLVGETLVRMVDGTEKPIRDVREGDLVETPSGPGHVSASRMTDPDAELAELILEDGRRVRGTPGHHFFDEFGNKKRLEDFMPGDTIRVWQYPKPSSSTGSPSAATRTPGNEPTGSISRPPRTTDEPESASCTRKSGSPCTVRSLTATTSTTGTGTRGTTTGATSCAFRPPSTTPSTDLQNGQSERVGTSTAFAPSHRHGTDPPPASRGTASTPLPWDLGPTDPTPFGSTVLPAGPSSSIEPAIRRGVSAGTPVSQRGAEERGSTTSTACVSAAAKDSGRTATTEPGTARVVALRLLSERGSVYNITVDRVHRFYANGILSANCDSLRYGWASRKRGGNYEPVEVRAAKEITAIDPNHRAMQERLFLSREMGSGGFGENAVTLRGRRRWGADFE